MPEQQEPFKVGEVVWYAECRLRQIEHPCPICFGKKKVVLILGDDSRVELDCGCCARPCQPPRGVVTEWELVAAPRKEWIRRIDQRTTADGVELDIRGDSVTLTGKIFRTEAEALAKCQELAAIQKEEEAKRLKYRDWRSYSWNAGYHMRQVKEARKKVEYHEQKAVLCKAKAKKGVQYDPEL